jgi:hypothetical protein
MKNNGLGKYSEFPVWLFESRILKHEWANTNVASVYSYMLARYRFHNAQERDYFESYEYIAEKVGLSVRTVKKVVSLLNENKHLEIKKRRTPAGINNVYIIMNVYDTWNLEGKKSSQESSKNATNTKKSPSLLFADELKLEMERESESLVVSNRNSKKPEKKGYTYNNEWDSPDHELPPWERSTKEPSLPSTPSEPIVKAKKTWVDDESGMPF